ncbi:conserved membrane protein of unknown function [Thermococcus nautili]|uniref:hypothetical protein n=1 Tax=Thermococcus nautili TaxID=195522 RepID=UPI002554D9BE|nr:hypothetical protein [Thermococcus nautili]CAI1493096.1 conserved membrane protein of unknown function [Thermococcus nautili]
MGFKTIHFLFLFATMFLMSYYSGINTYLSWLFFTITWLGAWLLLRVYNKREPITDERTELITMKSLYNGMGIGLVVFGYELIWLIGHDSETAVLLSKWLMLPLLAGVLAAAILKAYYERVM